MIDLSAATTSRYVIRARMLCCLVAAVASGCASPRAAPVAAAPPRRCAHHPRAKLSPAVREKLDAKLYAAMVQGGLDARVVPVVVKRTCGLDALRTAGLRTGFSNDTGVSGHIELCQLPALAALPGVLHVELEPTVYPN